MTTRRRNPGESEDAPAVLSDFDLTSVDPLLPVDWSSLDVDDLGDAPTALGGQSARPTRRGFTAPPPSPRPSRPYAPLPSLGDVSQEGDFGGSEFTNVAQMVDGNVVVADRYVIEAPIAAGGMGRVYKVRHRRLGKPFALKLMRTQFSGDSVLRERFYEEARLASSLAHPNIVSVIDFGEDPKLGGFMVMELLEGEPLAAKLAAEGRLPLKLACEVILEIAEALHYIHERQIIHCDVKVDNILLCPLVGEGRRRLQVKLLDFGIARIHSKAPIPAGTMTVDGTPEYVAPERLCGLQPQPSMDIYSLGILSYQLLTGRLPFTGNLAAIADAHLNQAPPKFDRAFGIDERAEQMVMRALEKEPERRQPGMAAFLYELRTLMDMLGFGRGRRRNNAAATQTARAASPQGKRERASRSGFERAPLPMAGVNVDGRIIVANPAFARFLTGKLDEPVDGQDLSETMLASHDRELPSELRRVHITDEPVQHILALKRPDGVVIRLLLLLFPAGGEDFDIHLTIHPLETPI